MAGEVGCRTITLSDIPAESDAFGAHSKVSQAIADLVSSEPGGRFVGVSGRWGSGKSTVINLLRNELNGEPDQSLVVFDAWAHEGDPLRRTFLETLIRHFATRQWIDVRAWQHRQDQLSRRRRKTESRTTPALTTVGKFVVAWLYLVPVFTVFLSRGLADDSDFLITLSLLVLLFPMTWLLTMHLMSRYIPWLRSNSATANEDTAPVWALFASKTVTDTTTETMEDPNPTSIEFQDLFSQLMDEALSDQDRTIVLVVDNLDRISSDSASSLWSTLQTFFQYSEHKVPAWAKRLWVIIPFDRSGAEQTWTRSDDDASLSASFLDKVFQIRFEVPPPVLTDWRAYLTSLLSAALPEHDNDEFHSIYRLYALARDNESLPPTPRELKLYVNQIGALHRQYSHEFPLLHLAYYAMLSRERRSVEDMIRDKAIPYRGTTSFIGESVETNLIALAHGIRADQVSQVILRDPIRRALESREPERLRELAKQPFGFWDVLEHTTQQMADEASSDPVLLSNIAYTLDAAELLHDSNVHAGVIRGALAQAASSLENLTPFDDDVAAGALAIYRARPSERLKTSLLSAVERSEGGTQSDELALKSWTAATYKLIDGMKSLHSVPTDTQVVVKPYEDRYGEVCRILVSIDPQGEHWKHFIPPNGNEVIDSLLPGSDDESWNTAIWDVIQVLLTHGAEYEWDTLVVRIVAVIDEEPNNPSESITSLLRSLSALSFHNGTAHRELGRLASQGMILSHLGNSIDRNNADSFAFCLYLQSQYQPNLQDVTTYGSSDAGAMLVNAELDEPSVDVVNEYCKYIIGEDMGEVLLEWIDKVADASRFVGECFAWIARHESITSVLGIDKTFARFTRILELVESAPDQTSRAKLLDQIQQSSELRDHAMSVEFKQFSADLYDALIPNDVDENNVYVKWLASGLRSLSLDVWSSHLHRNWSPLLNLVHRVRQVSKPRLTLATQFLEALLAHAGDLLSGSIKAGTVDSQWSATIDLIGSDTRRDHFRSRLAQLVVSSAKRPNQQFLNLYGEELMDGTILLAENNAMRDFIIVILRDGDAASLEWLARFVEKNVEAIRSYEPKHARDAFIELVEELRQLDQADPRRSPIETIAESVGALA